MEHSITAVCEKLFHSSCNLWISFTFEDCSHFCGASCEALFLGLSVLMMFFSLSAQPWWLLLLMLTAQQFYSYHTKRKNHKQSPVHVCYSLEKYTTHKVLLKQKKLLAGTSLVCYYTWNWSLVIIVGLPGNQQKLNFNLFPVILCNWVNQATGWRFIFEKLLKIKKVA